jgi:hypothetical protein
MYTNIHPQVLDEIVPKPYYKYKLRQWEKARKEREAIHGPVEDIPGVPRSYSREMFGDGGWWGSKKSKK